MFFSKLNAMSVGPLWVLRSQIGSEAELTAEETSSVLPVLAKPITDQAQQKLLENCLAAAGWNPRSACFSLHTSCSSNSATALQEYIFTHSPKLIIVFGRDAAQLIGAEFVLGQIHSFGNRRLIVTHHPEEMINNPALKAQVWVDLCLAKME